MGNFESRNYHRAESEALRGVKPNLDGLSITEQYQVDSIYQNVKNQKESDAELARSYGSRSYDADGSGSSVAGAYLILGIALFAGIFAWFSSTKFGWSLPVAIRKPNYDAWDTTAAPPGFVNVVSAGTIFKSPKGEEAGQIGWHVTQKDMEQWLQQVDLSEAPRGKRKGRKVVYIAELPKGWAHRFHQTRNAPKVPLTSGWMYEASLHQFQAIDSAAFKETQKSHAGDY